MQPEMKTIPNYLTVTQLQNGWKEFFCYLSLPMNEGISFDSITWKFSWSQTDKIVAGTHVITKQDFETGRVRVAVLLPPAWEGGEIIIETNTSQGVYIYEFPVDVFQQTNHFRLPLEEQVLILGGHRIGEVHRASWQIPSQQFAWDMISLDTNGLRLLNSQFTQNLKTGDFAAFGKNIIAPADGQVVQAVDGNTDWENVGELPKDIEYYLEDLTRACGNYIIIDHGGQVWSCLAHLRNGSVKTKLGDKIKVGEVIGEMGNSGFSSGPHLHIHFMDGPDLLTASPLPIQFDIEGTTYAPQAGEIVSS